MKKTITLISLVFSLNANAQFVTIPDVHFANYLQGLIPSAMSGNQMDTTNALVTTTTQAINVNNLNISNLSGIQYFSSLSYLDCGWNTITNFPALPISLTQLYCNNNNGLGSLPTLPNTLTYLHCGNTGLNNLPTLPNSLDTLICNSNLLSSLPVLPNSLIYLNCAGNSLTSLPTLPNSLTYLYCGYNSLTSLSTLPNSLQFLYCWYNQLTSLPSLPNSLTQLWCENNSLNTLPTLPNSLIYLKCENNNIACFPIFPDSITTLNINPNPYTCLPNYIPALGFDTVNYPLCSVGNIHGCPVVDTCPPYTTFVLSKDTLQSNTWNSTPYYSSNVINAKWYWGDGTSTLGLYTSHTYSTAGWYNLCVTVYSSCGDSLNVCQNDSLYRPSSNSSMVFINILNNTTDVKQNINSDNPIIYPNPTSDQFYIETNTTDKLNVDLYDVNGRHMFSKSVNDKSPINVTDLDEGIYTLTIKTIDRLINKKLVIVR